MWFSCHVKDEEFGEKIQEDDGCAIFGGPMQMSVQLHSKKTHSTFIRSSTIYYAFENEIS
jgi:hypothetical protein